MIRDPGVAAVLAAKACLHLLSIGLFAYGYMGDELYYLACTEHPALGYVDHPAGSIWLLTLVRALAGDSLLVLRLPALLAGLATIWLTADLARVMGGGAGAQRLAALTVAATPVYLTIGAYFSMNSFDLLVWAAAQNLLVRCVDGERRWGALGVVLALGLLNKLSVLWLGGAVWLGALLLHRDWLRTPGPWVASGIAAAGLAPYLYWNLTHDWATLAFIEGSRGKMVGGAGRFLLGQLTIMGPLHIPIWALGLAALLRGRWRLLGVVWLLVGALLLVRGDVRAYYLAAAYPALFAAGAVALQRWSTWVAVPVAGVGLVLAPLAVPLMPPDAFLRYEAAIGLSAPVEQASARGTPMPLHFAAKLAADPIVAGVEKAWARLSAEERERVVIVTQTYSEAAVIDFFGPERGWPKAICFRNAYWTWGPRGATGELSLVLADPEDAFLERFGATEVVATIDCPYCLGHISGQVVKARAPIRPLDAIWEELGVME